jgi:hypothetical protein
MVLSIVTLNAACCKLSVAFFIVMLNAIKLNATVLNAIKLNAIMLNAIMLNAFMLNGIMVNVGAPSLVCEKK